MNAFLDALRSNGATLGQTPQLTKMKAGFATDKKGRVKEDLEGNIIPKKDRRKLKNVLRNPFGLTPGMSLNFAAPNILTGQNIAGGGNFGNILSQVSRLGGGQ